MTGTFFFSSSPKATTQVRGRRGGRAGCQGGVHQRGKATGAHWTVQTADLLRVTGLRAQEPGHVALSQSDKKRALMCDRLCRASNNTLIQSHDEVKRAVAKGRAFVIVIGEMVHGALYHLGPGYAGK